MISDVKYFRLLGRKLPSLGMGTWRLGSKGDNPIQVLRRGLSYGLTVIDTAASYGVGYSESLVGKAIRSFDRDDLFIVSKVKQIKRSRKEIVDSARESCRRLGSYMDLFLLHTPPFNGKDLEERMWGLEDSLELGFANHIGVSNFSLAQVKDARDCLRKHDISCVQNRLNIHDKLWLHDVVPYTEHEGMLFMAEIPLDTRRIVYDDNLGLIAIKYDKSKFQVALNWLLCLPSVIPIPKTGQIEHLHENCGALNWRLQRDDWLRLEALKDQPTTLNKDILSENMRYYLTPTLFKIHLKHYLNPKNMVDYLKHTVYSRRNHI